MHAKCAKALRSGAVRSLVLTCVLLLAAAPARAADSHGFETAAPEPAETLAAREPPKRVFYGWQNIIVGYTGAFLVVHGYLSDSPMLMVTGAATYGFGGTVVHGVHGNATAAAVSPLIMAGGPLVLGAAAASADSEELAIFTVLYLLGAPVIDGALGREPAPSTQTVALTPTIRRDTVGLSFTGAF